MSFLRFNKELSRYEVKPSLRVLHNEMLRHLSIYYNYKVPRDPDTACIMIVKNFSIEYLFCDIADWEYYYSKEIQDDYAVIVVCDVTKGFEKPIKVRPYYLRNEKVKTFIDIN